MGVREKGPVLNGNYNAVIHFNLKKLLCGTAERATRIMERVGIFLFFDDEGYVDKYVEYLLDDIIRSFDKLVIVCNGVLSDDGRQILSKYSQDIIVRQNTGFDVGGFKFGMEYLGWNELEKYDEVVLFNDSFFGPLYPFKIVFDEMGSRTDVDFWGLSMHGAAPPIPNTVNPYGYRPRYLQTYFLVFRKKLVQAEIFQSYWNDMEEYKTFEAVATGFGPVLTKKFEDAGFRVGVYCDTTDLESDDITKNISNHTFNLYEMVANRRFPVLKRKTFITAKSTTLRHNYGNDLKKTMEYVRYNTEYDTALIYRYLLRKYNLDDIKKSLNLMAVVPDVDIYMGEKLYRGKKAAVIVHTFYPDMFDYVLAFLQNVPQEVDIIVTNGDEGQIEILREKFGRNLKNHLSFIKVEPRGRDLSALLVGCHDYIMQYDYLCFIHDKKSSQKENTAVGVSFRDLLWENMLFSEEYINNILNRFEENPCLGLQVPPNVYHGTYFRSLLNTWTICYEKVIEIAYALGITVPMEPAKEAFSVGTVFWTRTDALKTIFTHEWSYQDFPGEPLPGDGTLSHALERIFPYVAQHNGYYTEYVLNPQYAASELMNFRTMHNETVKALVGMPFVQFSTHEALVQTIGRSAAEFKRLRPRSRYPKYQLSYSILLCADKKLPAWLAGIMKRIIKIPKNTPVSNAVGVRGALSMWADEKAPRLIGKLIHKIIKM